MGDPQVVGETVATLHAFNIPLILASPKLADSVPQEGNILTTAPDMSGLVMVSMFLRKTKPRMCSNGNSRASTQSDGKSVIEIKELLAEESPENLS